MISLDVVNIFVAGNFLLYATVAVVVRVFILDGDLEVLVIFVELAVRILLVPIFLEGFEEADVEFITDLVDCVLATVRSFSVFEIPANSLKPRFVVDTNSTSGIVEFVVRDLSVVVVEV